MNNVPFIIRESSAYQQSGARENCGSKRSTSSKHSLGCVGCLVISEAQKKAKPLLTSWMIPRWAMIAVWFCSLNRNCSADPEEIQAHKSQQCLAVGAALHYRWASTLRMLPIMIRYPIQGHAERKKQEVFFRKPAGLLRLYSCLWTVATIGRRSPESAPTMKPCGAPRWSLKARRSTANWEPARLLDPGG